MFAGKKVEYVQGRKLPATGVNIDLDGHPNRYGNQLIAEELATLLKKFDVPVSAQDK